MKHRFFDLITNCFGIERGFFCIMPRNMNARVFQSDDQTRNKFSSQRLGKEGQHNIFLEPSPVKVHVVPTQVQLRKKLFLFVVHIFPVIPLSLLLLTMICMKLFSLFAEKYGDVDQKRHLVEFLLIIE